MTQLTAELSGNIHTEQAIVTPFGCLAKQAPGQNSRSGRLDAASPICRPRGRPRRNSVPSAPPVTLSSGTTDHADTAGSPVGQPDRAAPTGSATRTAVGVGGESNLCSPTSPASHRVTSASDGLTVSSTYYSGPNVSYSPINACGVAIMLMRPVGTTLPMALA